MAVLETDRPEFEEPPVAEVALAVQFERLAGLQPHVLADWSAVRERLPQWRLRDRMTTIVEVFGLAPAVGVRPSIEFSRAGEAPPTRSWFLSTAGTELLQIQDNALVRNWRRVSRERYPRYPTIRRDFERDYTELSELLAEKGLGQIVPTQCEVTYVNFIDTAAVPRDRTLAGFSGATSDEFLPEPEDEQFVLRYLMEGDNGQPIGRLHIQWRPAIDHAGNHVQQLRLTARGAPTSSNLDGILEWFDRGREWVVRGFASFTHSYMHENVWERSK